jgi:hypothetical protein
LKAAPDSGKLASIKAAIARRWHDVFGLDAALCAGALDILEAALYGKASAAGKPLSRPAPAKKKTMRKVLIPSAVLLIVAAAGAFLFFQLLPFFPDPSNGKKNDSEIKDPIDDLIDDSTDDLVEDSRPVSDSDSAEVKVQNVPANVQQEKKDTGIPGPQVAAVEPGPAPDKNNAEAPMPQTAPVKPAPAVENSPFSNQEQIYASYLNTPLEKYIPAMQKRLAETRTNGVEWQTIRAEYYDAAPRFILHSKLLPGWKNSEGLNEYDFVCYRLTNPDLSYMGSYAKYRTIEFRDTLAFDSKKRLETDSAYRAVVAMATLMCDEIDYNWAGYSGYRGTAPVPLPGKRLAVCDGYTDESMRRFSALDCVVEIQKWSVPGIHTWNVLKLRDGRTLYCDVTWFDNDHIDTKTGKTTYADDYDWENITFDENLFLYGQVSYGTRDFTHASARRVLADVIRLD